MSQNNFESHVNFNQALDSNMYNIHKNGGTSKGQMISE